MYDWCDLLNYSKLPSDQRQPLNRKPEIQESYDRFRQEYDPVRYITEKYFSGTNSGRQYVLVENSYPYDIVPWLSHYILWFNPAYPDIDYKYWVDVIVKDLSAIAWINPPNNQSVPGVVHYHIIYKIFD